MRTDSRRFCVPSVAAREIVVIYSRNLPPGAYSYRPYRVLLHQFRPVSCSIGRTGVSRPSCYRPVSETLGALESHDRYPLGSASSFVWVREVTAAELWAALLRTRPMLKTGPDLHFGPAVRVAAPAQNERVAVACL